MSRRACGSAALRLGGFAACAFHGGFAALRLARSMAICGFAALRLARSMAALRLCGFAACAFHGSFAALRLARSMAALRLCGLSVPWRLCGFDAFQGARVYPNPRAMVFLTRVIFVHGTSWYDCTFHI